MCWITSPIARFRDPHFLASFTRSVLPESMVKPVLLAPCLHRSLRFTEAVNTRHRPFSTPTRKTPLPARRKPLRTTTCSHRSTCGTSIPRAPALCTPSRLHPRTSGIRSHRPAAHALTRRATLPMPVKAVVLRPRRCVGCPGTRVDRGRCTRAGALSRRSHPRARTSSTTLDVLLWAHLRLLRARKADLRALAWLWGRLLARTRTTRNARTPPRLALLAQLRPWLAFLLVLVALAAAAATLSGLATVTEATTPAGGLLPLLARANLKQSASS